MAGFSRSIDASSRHFGLRMTGRRQDACTLSWAGGGAVKILGWSRPVAAALGGHGKGPSRRGRGVLPTTRRPEPGRASETSRARPSDTGIVAAALTTRGGFFPTRGRRDLAWRWAAGRELVWGVAVRVSRDAAGGLRAVRPRGEVARGHAAAPGRAAASPQDLAAVSTQAPDLCRRKGVMVQIIRVGDSETAASRLFSIESDRGITGPRTRFTAGAGPLDRRE